MENIMEWNKYRLETKVQAMELVTACLMENGINSFEVEDNIPLTQEEKEKMFIDILPELPEDERAYFTFYLEKEQDCHSIIKELLSDLENIRKMMDVGTLTLEQEVTRDTDWVNNWKKYFKPFEIDDIVIKPTWEPITQAMKGKMIVEMDPGTAFGTGMHETTQLVIRQIKKYKKDNICLLDVGCGSGILSIIGVLLGIEKAVGTDIDENAVIAAIENVKVNHIEQEKIQYFTGNILTDKNTKDQVGYQCYDMVVANILADVIVPLAGVITPHMKKGGIFISSGIIDTKEQEVLAAIQANHELEVLEVTYQNDWVSITARKK